MTLHYFDSSNWDDLPPASAEQVHPNIRIFCFSDIDQLIDAVTHNTIDTFEAKRLIQPFGLDVAWVDMEDKQYIAECVLILQE